MTDNKIIENKVVLNESITNTLLSTFISSTGSFKKQIVTVILMSSLDEIKKTITDICTYIRTNYKDICANIYNYANIYNFILYVYNLFKYRIFKKNSERIINNYQDTSKNIKFIGDSQMNLKLINYARSKKDCECEMEEIYQSSIENGVLIHKTTISKIIIHYEGMRLSTLSSFRLSLDKEFNILKSDYCTYIMNKNLNELVDLMGPGYEDVINYVNKCYEYSNSNRIVGSLMYGDDNMIYSVTGLGSFYQSGPTVLILNILQKNGYIMSKTFILKFSILIILITSYATSKLFNIGYFKNLYINDQTHTPIRVGMVDYFKNVYNVFLLDDNIKIKLCKFFNDTMSINPLDNKISSDNKELEFSIINYDEKSYIKLINEITNININTSNKIKIFQLSIKEIETKKSVTNKEYQELTDQISQLTKIGSDTKDLNSKLAMCKKEIEEIVCTHEINRQQVSEKFRDFNTLYLQKEAKEKLFNVLKLYKTNKQAFETFGLQDKLGILLYGLPGTGKTTCITTIASYLELNLNIIDMSTIKTNEQLTAIFRSINSDTEKGIAVFEDIDILTNIVLQRTNDVSNGELTLSHFLNLLDGSLTKDGTIFIVTTNYKDKLDTAFTRDGRFNVSIEMKNADHYQCGEIFKTFFKRELSKELLDMLPENTFVPAKFIFYLAKYIYCDIVDGIIISDFCKSLENQ